MKLQVKFQTSVLRVMHAKLEQHREARPQNEESDIREYYDQLQAISYTLSLLMWNIIMDKHCCSVQQ